MEGRMSEWDGALTCACGDAEDDHGTDGACCVAGCGCDEFEWDQGIDW